MIRGWRTLREFILKISLKKINIKIGANALTANHLFDMEESSSIQEVKLVGGANHYIRCGCYSYFRSGSVIGSVKIGRFCSISTEVVIGIEQNGHPLNWLSTSPFQYSDNGITNLRMNGKLSYDPVMSETTIGHDVWIGNRVIVYNGCNVGTGSVIAAGSIVTKSVPPYAIVAGIPAKIIAYRFDDQIIKVLLKSKWWELPEHIVANITFNHESEFINELQKVFSGGEVADYKRILFQACVVK